MSAPVALVTGAAHRIGRGIALALARDGFDVAVHFGSSEEAARQTVDDIKALGRRAFAFQADLADPAANETMMTRIAATLGPVEALVNSASAYEYDDAESWTVELFDRHMAVNARAPLQLTQLMVDGLPDGAEGAVVNILDQKLFNDNPDFFSYTMSKRVLHAGTEMLARSVGSRCRVNAVAPGLTLVSGVQDRAHFEKVHGMTPLGRGSTLDDIADAVCYLIRARAITGATLPVDCGMRFVPLDREVMFFDTSGRDPESNPGTDG